MPGRRTFYVETLGCPKNQVDSDKLVGTLLADGMAAVDAPEDADLVVVNTCAFIEEARQESIDVVLALADRKATDAEIVVTGCMAERYGDELAQALPEVDAVAGFGVPVTLGRKPGAPALPSFDLLNLPRPPASAPWAYVKVAEGCDKACGFCAIPTFRGPQRSRTIDQILGEVDQLVAGGAKEIVLVAQDLARYGRDQGVGDQGHRAAGRGRGRPRSVGAAAVPVPVRAHRSARRHDPRHWRCRTSTCRCSTCRRRCCRRMRRWGDGDRFLGRIDDIRKSAPEAAFRSNFIVGYPGETEDDHDQLLRFVDQAQLDWCGFFAYSQEDGTYAGRPRRRPCRGR